MVLCDSCSKSQSSIKLKFTDKYHQDNQYWIQTEINVNIFATEPPQFVTNLENIIVNLWNNDQNVYKLPEISDIDSRSFNVSLAKDIPNWIHILCTDNKENSSQQFYVRIFYLLIELKVI